MTGFLCLSSSSRSSTPAPGWRSTAAQVDGQNAAAEVSLWAPAAPPGGRVAISVKQLDEVVITNPKLKAPRVVERQ